MKAEKLSTSIFERVQIQVKEEKDVLIDRG